ncbi:MAG: SUMF1/EgtB/PvdO family nonheme iron enzyme [Gammaproteobacteria bacterium]|nr:SUMF1/EgtB/PvdO family nonheme iron enzyme [Gammaproteobacteria bacterium]
MAEQETAMRFAFNIAGAQIDGARDYQEDAFLITHLGDKEGGASLVIVADGMGGHAAGNVASNLAVQAFNRHVSANFPNDNLPAVLNESVLKANNAIAETVRETPALKGMGCTLVCAIVSEKYLRWASVGDSNLYLLRDNQLRKKNADHSYGGFLDRMAAEGKAVEPEPGFSRNMLMSALTGDDIADIDCPQTPLELQPGDRIIIASDGLDTLSDGKIVHICGASGTAKECADNLLQGVTDENLPRQDNTTIVVIDVAPAGAAVPPPDPEIEEITLESGDDLEDRTEPKGAAAAAAAAAAAGAQPAPPGRSGGLIAAVVVGVLVLAAAAGYFLFVPGTQAPPVAVLEPEPEEPAQPAPATAPEAAIEPAPAPATVTAPAPQPAPEAVAAMPAPTAGSFRDPLKSGGQGPEMVVVAAGRFAMGEQRMAGEFDEKPSHEVRVPKFAIGRYEVTLAQYEKFARATGRRMPDNAYLDKDTHPVFSVTWDDALYYTRWLSEQTGRSYRLPTEAEWEYAARGGTTTPYWWGLTAGQNNAHCFGCGSAFDPRKPTRIGSFKPNPIGLYDTAGNVAEWVRDCYHPNYDGAPNDGSVWEGGDCSVRVIRGGSFASPPKSIRSPKRDKHKADGALETIGIRVVREP